VSEFDSIKNFAPSDHKDLLDQDLVDLDFEETSQDSECMDEPVELKK